MKMYKNGGKKLWKYFSAFCVLFLLSLPVFSESSEEFTVPVLEPEAIYELTGADVMTLYEELNNLNNLSKELLTVSKESIALNKEYGKENSQLQQQNRELQIQNSFLVGTTVFSVGIVVAGVITLVVMNIN